MNIDKTIQSHANKHPKKPFIVWRANDIYEDRLVITYSQFDLMINSACLTLRNKNVHKNQSILIHLNNKPEFLVALFACLRIGATPVLSNTAWKGQQIKSAFRQTRPTLVITETKYKQLFENSEIKILLDQDLTNNHKRNNIEKETSRTAKRYITLFTSGSSGEPKAIDWSEHETTSFSEVCTNHFGVTNKDISLCFMPLFHTMALVYQALCSAYSGSTLILQKEFSPTSFWKIATQESCTWTANFGYYALQLKGQPFPKENPFNFWVLGVTSPQVDEKLNLKTIGLWGMTETGCPALITDRNQFTPFGSIGRPHHLYDVKLINENLQECGPAEIGSLFVRSNKHSDISSRYLESNNKNDNSWFETGDYAQKDHNGNYFFVCRDFDRIKVGNELVNTRDIENIIIQVSEVIECATVGAKDDLLGELPYSFVVTSPQVNRQTLLNKILTTTQQKLPHYQQPSEVIFLEELPRKTIGKVDKNALRAILTEENPAIKIDKNIGNPDNDTSMKALAICKNLKNNLELTLSSKLMENEFDSIDITNLRSEILETFKISISLKLMYSCKTILEVCELISYKKNLTSSSKLIDSPTQDKHIF